MPLSFNTIFFPNDSKLERFKVLDGLRGMAILFVLLSHSSNQQIFLSKFLDFQSIGKIGVYLFFVLSAYLLDRQIALALMSGNATGRFWLNYFLRRFLRIYPLFVIALLIFGLAQSFGLDTGINFFTDTPPHLVFIRANTIFWSVAVEFKYYFISPLLLVICHHFLRWKLVATLIFLLSIVVLAILFRDSFPGTYTATIPYLPVFMVGTIISIIEIMIKRKTGLRQYSLIIEVAGILAMLVILLSIPYYFYQATGMKFDVQSSVFFMPYGLLWGAVLVASKYGQAILTRLFRLNPLRFLGIISYSLYLFHMPVLLLVDAPFMNIPQELKIYAFFAFSILVATLSYVLIERPLSRIRLYQRELTEAQAIPTKNVRVK